MDCGFLRRGGISRSAIRSQSPIQLLFPKVGVPPKQVLWIFVALALLASPALTQAQDLVGLDWDSGNLYRVNPSSASLTLIILTALTPAVGAVGGMTIQNGVGYFNTGGPGSSIPGSNELWTFNSYTGVHSLVGSLASTITGVGMCGLTAVGNPASATSRNAGSNPASYTAVTLPILGTTYTGSVDLGGTTGHNLAWLVGYSTPATVTFGGGQTLLVNVVDPNGELLAQPFVAGPVATFDIPIPADTSLFGIQASTQALHVGGVTPYALSNAQDLLLGYQLRAGRASSA